MGLFKPQGRETASLLLAGMRPPLIEKQRAAGSSALMGLRSRQALERVREDYNSRRPHSSPGKLTPGEYARPR
jgi:transposase InsO family protein